MLGRESFRPASGRPSVDSSVIMAVPRVCFQTAHYLAKPLNPRCFYYPPRYRHLARTYSKCRSLPVTFRPGEAQGRTKSGPATWQVCRRESPMLLSTDIRLVPGSRVGEQPLSTASSSEADSGPVITEDLELSIVGGDGWVSLPGVVRATECPLIRGPLQSLVCDAPSGRVALPTIGG